MAAPRRQPALIGVLVVLCLANGPARAAAADVDPAQLLKSRGLKASGWVYVLEKEDSFHSKLVDTRSHYQDWLTSLVPLQRYDLAQQEIGQMTQDENTLKQYVAQLRRQMSSLGNGRGRTAQYHRMQRQVISTEVNQAQANLNAMTQQLNQLKKNLPKPQDKKKAEGEESSRRSSLHDEVAELVKFSEEIQRTYHELHMDKDVEKALTSLGQTGNAKLKLGPSHEHQADLKVLQKLRHELAIGGSPVKEGTTPGSKPHGKISTHAKKKYSSKSRTFVPDESIEF